MKEETRDHPNQGRGLDIEERVEQVRKDWRPVVRVLILAYSRVYKPESERYALKVALSERKFSSGHVAGDVDIR